jgi:hypothetical protein
MGHDIGISASYYKPNENEVLEDYLKAVESLTLCNNNVLLKKQLADLEQKSKHSENIIESRLQEKDSELMQWKKKYLKDMKGLIS